VPARRRQTSIARRILCARGDKPFTPCGPGTFCLQVARERVPNPWQTLAREGEVVAGQCWFVLEGFQPSLDLGNGGTS